MSYYELSGLGQVQWAAAGLGQITQAAAGLGALFFDGGKAFWKVDSAITVSEIAQKVYGNASLWTEICKYNTSIGIQKDPKTPPGDCWYKIGQIIELPKIAGYPDPAAAAPKSGLPTLAEGTTVVTSSGDVVKVGSGGQIKGGIAAASMGVKVGIAALAIAAIAGLAIVSKKKKKGTSV